MCSAVGGESEQSIVDKVIETPPYKFDKRDIILYALGGKTHITLSVNKNFS